MVFLSRILRAEVSKQSLMTLRKSTGHSFQHCKKALEQNNNDVQQAVAWLQAEALKQGWTKLERVEGRSALQGILALANSGRNLIAVTEMNCETDFVSRNVELRGFAHKISETVCENVQKSSAVSPSVIQKLSWDKISQLVVDGQSVEEGRARLVAKVGEKVDLRHSLVVAAGEGQQLAAACHPDPDFGKYGAALLYKGGDKEVAEQICRHIIGMKPVSIGKMEDLEKELDEQEAEFNAQKEAAANAAEGTTKSEEAEEAEEESTPQRRRKDEERRLLMQDFVFDPDTTVGELLQDNDMEITKFWRFECAQEVVESKD